MNVEPATEYGRLILIRKGIINCIRIRLFDSDCYNHASQLVWGNNLYVHINQAEALGATNVKPLSFYDEVWFEGVCLYRKHWLIRLFHSFKRD